MHRFFQFLVLAFNPFITLDYFRKYLFTVEQIILFGNKKLKLRVHLVNFFLVIAFIHFLYISFHNSGNFLENSIQFDGFYILLGKAQVNLMAVGCILQIVYFNYHLFFKPNLEILNQLKLIVVDERHSFFLESKLKNGKNVCIEVRKIFVWCLKAFVSIGPSVELMWIIVYFIVIYNFWINRNYFFENSIIYFIIKFIGTIAYCHLMAFLWGLYLMNYTHSMAINFSCTITLLRIVYIKFAQIYKILLMKIYSHENGFDLIRYIWFRKQFTSTLIFFFAVNRMYGKTFLAFLVIFVPINTLYSIWAIEGNVPVHSRYFMIFFVTYLSNFLFSIHLILAFCTKHIHKPSKPLLHLMAHSQNCKSISPRTRIKLANLICAFHTKRRYGFTYGDFGLVTLMAFVKYLLLYGESMMTAKKLLLKKYI